MRSIAILSLWFTATAVAWAQATAVPDQNRRESVQRAAGEGDPGESAEVDEAADAKPHDGP